MLAWVLGQVKNVTSTSLGNGILKFGRRKCGMMSWIFAVTQTHTNGSKAWERLVVI